MKNFFLVLGLVIISGGLYAQRTWDSIPYGPDGFRATVERFRKESTPTGKVLFLGNSITAGGNWKLLLKDSSIINRGISGDITYGILARIDEVVKRKPAKVFLLIGINDISKNIPDEHIIENIFSIVGKIRSGSPKTVIFVQSILPTNPAFPKFPDHINKDDHVVTINDQLKKYGERLRYTYVDLYTKFLDGQSHLDAKYTGDGLHLNSAGYAQWVSILKSLKYL